MVDNQPKQTVQHRQVHLEGTSQHTQAPQERDKTTASRAKRNARRVRDKTSKRASCFGTRDTHNTSTTQGVKSARTRLQNNYTGTRLQTTPPYFQSELTTRVCRENAALSTTKIQHLISNDSICPYISNEPSRDVNLVHPTKNQTPPFLELPRVPPVPTFPPRRFNPKAPLHMHLVHQKKKGASNKPTIANKQNEITKASS